MSTFNTITTKSGGAKPSRDWEVTFTSWGTALGTTEQTKCENAERAVRKAIGASTKLSSKKIEVFTQGSYANRTNVRQDSDVDVCVTYADAFFADYSMSEGLTGSVLGHTDADYPYSEFKNDVGVALVSFFGQEHVTRGNKAFDVHANTYRIDADVVPAFELRRFRGTPENNWYHSGTQILPGNGGKITNWPRQNYDNGVTKNDATGRRFKAVTRILKRLRNEMADEGYDAAKPIPSYLIECLVWNVPNDDLGHDTLRADVRHTLAHLWNETRTDETCKEWGEVNELKYLFRIGQPWTREQVKTFLQAAWDYIGFE
jgi:tRNA nucleotidyltransferase (CCA-adding enzyme)